MTEVNLSVKVEIRRVRKTINSSTEDTSTYTNRQKGLSDSNNFRLRDELVQMKRALDTVTVREQWVIYKPIL